MTDGISRAIDEFVVPSVGLIVFVAAVKHLYGAQEAGIVYLVATGFVLLTMHSKAKYWNIPYTAAVGTVGLLAWFGLPHALPQLVPPMFATIGSVAGGAIILSIGLMTIEKIG
jgi:hypothetical protein